MIESLIRATPVPYGLRVPCSQDFDCNPRELTQDDLVQRLDDRCEIALEAFLNSEQWKRLDSPDADPVFVRDAVREICLETAMSQIEITEAWNSINTPQDVQANIAIFAILGGPPDWSTRHQDLLIEDYMALGGVARDLWQRQLSPTTFATAASWRMIAGMRDAFVCVGADYAYAVLAPTICKKLQEVLDKQECRATGRPTGHRPIFSRFITSWVDKAADCWCDSIPPLCTAVDEYPESKPNLCYGFEYLIDVYPLPGWKAAIDRAALQLEM